MTFWFVFREPDKRRQTDTQKFEVRDTGILVTCTVPVHTGTSDDEDDSSSSSVRHTRTVPVGLRAASNLKYVPGRVKEEVSSLLEQPIFLS